MTGEFVELPKYVQQRIAVQPNGCWLWLGANTLKNKQGYGVLRIGTNGRTVAHKWVYEFYAGVKVPFPENEIDHTCKVKACVNPRHLEVVDKLTNQLRADSLISRHVAKTHCAQGHELVEGNLHLPSLARGWRVCLLCRNHTPKKRVSLCQALAQIQHRFRE